MTQKEACGIFILAAKINRQGIMNDIQSFTELTAKIQYRINANDKKPKSFGTRHKLYQSEIHFIDAIGLDGGYSASELSEKLGITNGAVTQVSDKLLRKKLIEKGYYQLQKSVYIMRSKTKEKIELAEKQLSMLAPENSSIRSIILTEDQFQKMKVLAGEVTMGEKISQNKILEF